MTAHSTPGPRRRTTIGALRREDGQALVEFALVLPLLLTLLLGMLDFGKAFNYWIDSTHLANEGARWAVVNKNPGGAVSLQNYIKQQATTSQLRSGATVCITLTDLDGNGTYGAGDAVEMTVSYPYNWLSFFQRRLAFATTTIRGAATMRLEATPTSFSPGCSS